MQAVLPALLVCACLLTSKPSRAAWPDSLSGHWTNGYMEYSSGNTARGRWLFSGGNVHEGGYSFTAFAKNDSAFEIGNRTWEIDRDSSMNRPDFGKRGDRLVLSWINGRRVLMAVTPSGALRDFLVEEPNSFDLASFQRANRTRYQLAGKFVDSASHNTVVFSPDQPVVAGFPAGDHYSFASAYDFLEDVLVFPKNKPYFYARTDMGLDLLEAIGNGDEEYTKGKPLMHLDQFEWLNISGDSSLRGKFAFASSTILTYDICNLLTPWQRKICRNEIYARHGYVFKTREMQTYFQNQPWYQQQFESVDDKLTELERLNIRILQSADK